MKSTKRNDSPFAARTYRGKRVWLTGDTGFKGSRTAYWLHRLGAEVMGVGLEPESAERPFLRAKLSQLFRHETADIRDAERMAALVRDFVPPCGVLGRLGPSPISTWSKRSTPPCRRSMQSASG